jgi:subtilase family serine protease
MRFGSDRSRRGSRPGARLRHAAVILASAAALLAVGATTAAAAPVQHTQNAASSAAKFKHACPTPTRKLTMQCMVLIDTAVAQKPASAMAVSPAATPAGYGPSQLQSAYNLASAAAANGAGETVYIVDAYDYPTAQADLNSYRSQYGLPACGSGCFTKVNQHGATSPLPSAAGSTGWDVEEALDIDMVSAICPLCHITLVEANSASNIALYTAENSAVSLGAKFISNSWGGNEYSGETTDANTYFNHPGVAITVSAGDSPGPEFPAEAQYVTAVGGTTLSTSSNSRGWTESPWSSAGGGCSSYAAAPSWQSSSVTGCSKREDNDVSADADPNTGAAIYNSYSQGGWLQVGGTSESSPIIASVYALAGTPASGSYPSQDIWAHEPSGLYPVGSGYSSVPGWGTPNGTTAFTSGSGGGTGNTVTVTNPGSQSATAGTAVSLQISASDSASGQTLTYSASGLPAGLSISSSGLISGTPTTAGTYPVTVTAKDTTGASGSASFTWTVGSGSGSGCTAKQLLGNPGFETGTASPWTMTAGVLNNSSSEPPHSGSWDAWLDGYGTTHTDTLAQTVTVPSGCTAYQASFWLHIDTAETTTTTQYDTLKVQVLNSSGTVLATLATFSNLNAASGYTQHTYNVSAYAGQTITLKFTGTEDFSLQTSFVVDDTAINVS